MPQLSTYFSEAEFGLLPDTAERIKSNARYLCVEILEKTREYVQESMIITSGYRPPEVNDHAHGVEHSFHLYEGGKAAADFKLKIMRLEDCFDYIRIASGILYDKIILEYDLAGNAKCIHTQLDITQKPRLQAFVGHTGDLGGHIYQQVNALQTVPQALEALQARVRSSAG